MSILIADDSRVIRQMLADTLAEAGYEVIEAADGAEAWQRIEAGGIHLAILDWMMPPPDGLEICRRLAERQATDPVYAILLTARDRTEDIATALRAGASDYVTKPFQAEELLARIAVGQRLMRLQVELAEARKLESVGRLAAGIAHEFNTPLQFLSDNTNFLQDACAVLLEQVRQGPALPDAAAACEGSSLEFLAEEIPRALAQSREGIVQVAAIVSMLKEFSAPGGHAAGVVEIGPSVRRAVSLARRTWDGVATVTICLEDALPPVMAAASDLTQVVYNLIVNAAQAVERSGRAGQGQIRIAAQTTEAGIELQIVDNGDGIAATNRDRVFDPFFTTQPEGQGKGQGLTVAHYLVTGKLGGSLSFSSTPGKSTTFFVRIPFAVQQQDNLLPAVMGV